MWTWMALFWALIGRISLVQILCTCGIAAIIYFIGQLIYSLWKGLYVNFLGPLLGHSVDLRKMGQWAVVTGATDGIGKAYVEELAKIGLNVVLISRNLEKLENLAKDISDEFNVSTKVIAVDFTGGVEIYDVIRAGLEGLQIGILVNNVGMSYNYPEMFTNIPDGEKFITDMLNCNCLSVTMMTHMVLPWMVRRKKGVILNLSSFSSLLPLPYMSLYTSVKKMQDVFTQSIEYEYRETGVIIQSVVPFYVTTNMSKIRKSSFIVPTPKDYVRGQLKTIGLERRTYGYIAHSLIGFFAELVTQNTPKSLYVDWMAKAFRSSRDNYLQNKRKYSKKQ